MRPLACVTSLSLPLLSLPGLARAHGFAGKRFFLTTLTIDDPFVSDEFSLLVHHTKGSGEGEEPPTLSTEISAEYSKRSMPRLGLAVGGAFRRLEPDGESLEVAAKYQLFTSAPAEALLSLRFAADVGGTENRRGGAESVTTLSPALFFGKGFGDVSVPSLKPLALTGLLALDIPTRRKTVPRFRSMNVPESTRVSSPYCMSLSITCSPAVSDAPVSVLLWLCKARNVWAHRGSPHCLRQPGWARAVHPPWKGRYPRESLYSAYGCAHHRAPQYLTRRSVPLDYLGTYVPATVRARSRHDPARLPAPSAYLVRRSAVR